MAKKVLVISPHPDDETLGAGGSIVKLINEGHEVLILTVSGHLPPLYDKEDKGVKEGKMIRFIDDGKGSIVVKGKNDETSDGCSSAGFIASCRAADKNPWNKFGTIWTNGLLKV